MHVNSTSIAYAERLAAPSPIQGSADLLQLSRVGDIGRSWAEVR